MAFVMGLEENRDVEHRLLQKIAFGAELVGGDRFVLEAEGNVEDRDVAGHVGRESARGGDAAHAAQEGDRAGGERRAGAGEERAARGRRANDGHGFNSVMLWGLPLVGAALARLPPGMCKPRLTELATRAGV